MNEWWALLPLFVLTVSSFNIDTKQAVIHTKSNKFGYALDFFYKNKGLPVLVVGAPEARSSFPNLAGIQRPGAAYFCSVQKGQQGVCEEWQADKDYGNERRLNGSVQAQIEDKSDQKFGATVVASRNKDKLMVCAPNYRYYFPKFVKKEPVGTCFLRVTGKEDSKELSSCKQDNQQHDRHRLGYGQCGFSVAIPDFGGRSYVGGPGMYYWQGGLFSQKNDDYFDRPKTLIGRRELDNTLLGYALGTGNFDGDKVEDAVAGMPRGDDLRGLLALYTTKLDNIVNLTDTSSSSQVGQYCGHSVAVTDVNNDGLDDIITGCPFYTDFVTVVDSKTQERKPQYEVGKIIVFLQEAAGTFSAPLVVTGTEQWGRFGFSVAAAGDLNQDGFNDIIIGAPRGGNNRKGAVFVLHGHKDGVRTKPTQKIEAGSVSGSLKSFGFSLTGGVDVDGNNIPDIAVGAVDSASAIVLLSKPVVTITGSALLDSKTVDIDSPNCHVDNKLGRQACRKLTTCLEFNNKGVASNELEVKLSYSLDDLVDQPRAHFIELQRGTTVSKTSKTKDHPNAIEQIVTVQKGAKRNCFDQKFFVTSTMRDRLSPIHYTVNYTLVESATGRSRDGKLEPALDNTVPLAFEGKLSIANNCGNDEKCIPNLGVDVQTRPDQKFVLGDDRNITVTVNVENTGEDAFESKLYFNVPEGFDFGGITTTSEKTAPACTPASKREDETLYECDIGNPMAANKKKEVKVTLNVNEDKPPSGHVNITVFVNSTNPEGEGYNIDNRREIAIDIESANSLYLGGTSLPDQLNFYISNTSGSTIGANSDETAIGPLVVHKYEVRNEGSQPIDIELDILWPSLTTSNNPLFYLLENPTLTPGVRGECKIQQEHNINPLKLKVGKEYRRDEMNAYSGAVTPTAASGGGWSDDDRDSGAHEEDEETVSSARDESASHEGGFEWHENPDNAKQQYGHKFIPDPSVAVNQEEDDFADDDYDENRRALRVKRSSKQTNLATFSDLKELVSQSKTLGAAVVNTNQRVSRGNVVCRDLKCTHVKCNFYSVEKKQSIVVEMSGRLANHSLVQEGNPGGDVSSLALARAVHRKFTELNKALAVTTHVNAIQLEGSRELPWWIYLLAILIGLLILALLILLLWRCGFFKRNRPPTEKAALLASNDPDARYADTKSRYAREHDEGRPML